MRIAVDARAIPYTGMGNYTKSLLDLLPRLFPADTYMEYDDALEVSRRNYRAKYVNNLRRIYREQIGLPRWLKKNDIDIFFSPRNKGIPYNSGCASVVTVHDVLPYAMEGQYISSVFEKYYYNLMTSIAVNRSCRVVTDSVFSRDEIVKYTGIAPDKCSVVYLGYNPVFRRLEYGAEMQELKNRYGLKRPFLLSIGGSEYRKNIRLLLDVYQGSFMDSYDMVVIGGAWRGIDLAVEYESDKIHFLQGISDFDMALLYNMTELFVFPSLYEGFGLPVLEAMACGAPVAAANSSSIPEVVGDSAVLFNPLSSDDMRQKLYSVLDDKQRLADLSEQGLQRCRNFSWEKTAVQLHNIFEELMV